MAAGGGEPDKRIISAPSTLQPCPHLEGAAGYDARCPDVASSSLTIPLPEPRYSHNGATEGAVVVAHTTPHEPHAASPSSMSMVHCHHHARPVTTDARV